MQLTQSEDEALAIEFKRRTTPPPAPPKPAWASHAAWQRQYPNYVIPDEPEPAISQAVAWPFVAVESGATLPAGSWSPIHDEVAFTPAGTAMLDRMREHMTPMPLSRVELPTHHEAREMLETIGQGTASVFDLLNSRMMMMSAMSSLEMIVRRPTGALPGMMDFGDFLGGFLGGETESVSSMFAAMSSAEPARIPSQVLVHDEVVTIDSRGMSHYPNIGPLDATSSRQANHRYLNHYDPSARVHVRYVHAQRARTLRRRGEVVMCAGLRKGRLVYKWYVTDESKRQP